MGSRKTPHRRPGPSRRANQGPGEPFQGPAGSQRRDRDGALWLYGRHAATAAAANPDRVIRRLVALASLAPELAEAVAASGVPRPDMQIAERDALDSLLPAGAVHQGVAVLAEPLPAAHLDDVLATAGDEATLVVLDQATDPRNVGAVLRTAAGFGALAVVLQDRHAPAATGVLAKAASGGLERVPLVRVVNLARAMRRAQESGFWCIGLDASAPDTLAEADPEGRICLVLGAEGAGLRRLTRETCDRLARIPIAGVESLNVSAAAAIALYEVARGRR